MRFKFLFYCSIFLMIVCLPFSVKAQTIPSHLKYFGYYTATFDREPYGRYSSEINNFGNSNVIRIRFNTLDMLNGKNLLGIVSPPGGATYENFLSGWETWKSTLTQDQINKIYAFYYDEPFWKGHDDPTFLDRFLKITQKIRTDFPDKAIMVVEAYPMFQNDKDLNYVKSGLQYVTDFGFDYYYVPYGGTWNDALNYYNRMKSISGNRKIWLVPDGFAKDPGQIGKLTEAFNNYVNLAKSDPNVVGILQFVYGDGLKTINTNAFMIPGSPYYSSSYRQLEISTGKAIIANALPTTPKPTPRISGDFDSSGHVDYADFQKIVANFGNPYGIFNYNNLISNYGK